MTALRQRLIEDLRIRNRSPNTIRCYVLCVADFAKYFDKSPDRLGAEHIHQYQLHLIDRGVSWSTLNQAVAALRFFYNRTLTRQWMIEHLPYAKNLKRPPTILARSEVETLLVTTKNLKHNAVLSTLYATGLRSAELCNLIPADIDSKRMVVNVREGKGQKARCVMLSQVLLGTLRSYWLAYHPKTWLFEGRSPGHQLGATTVYEICVSAGRRAGVQKRVHPHALRHAFATQLLEAGYDLRRIQLLLGHKSIRTTASYLHVCGDFLRTTSSPLDLLASDGETKELVVDRDGESQR